MLWKMYKRNKGSLAQKKAAENVWFHRVSGLISEIRLRKLVDDREKLIEQV